MYNKYEYLKEELKTVKYERRIKQMESKLKYNPEIEREKEALDNKIKELEMQIEKLTPEEKTEKTVEFRETKGRFF